MHLKRRILQDLAPRVQPVEREPPSASGNTGASPGSRGPLSPERQPQLEGQDSVDQQLKKLLLETVRFFLILAHFCLFRTDFELI